MITRNKLLFRLSFLFVVFLFLAVTAMAQSTATLQGTVRDQKGDVVPGAKVTPATWGQPSSARPKPIQMGITNSPHYPWVITRLT